MNQEEDLLCTTCILFRDAFKVKREARRATSFYLADDGEIIAACLPHIWDKPERCIAITKEEFLRRYKLKVFE